MAFVNLPPNLQDIFYSITDRIAKLETGPNQAMYYAEAAQGSSSQALAEAAAADALGTLALAQATYAIAQGTQAIQTANAALVQANAAYTLGAQSLQKSASTITNASNQLTAINGTGITVYSGASATSGARVVLNSAGLAGFNSAGTSTFAIDASTGAVSTNGAIFTSSTISGGSLNINGQCTINSAGVLYANGATIIGNITATSGTFTGTVYASAGSFTGTITSANATITGGSLTVGPNFQVNSLGQLTASSANITGQINATTGTIGGFTIGGTFLQSANMSLYSTGDLSGTGTAYMNYIAVAGASLGSYRFAVQGDSGFYGTITSTGSMTAQGELVATFGNNNPLAASANVYMTSGGAIRKSSSSARYKAEIEQQNVPVSSILSLEPKSFVDKSSFVAAGSAQGLQRYLGLVAEDVALIPVLKDLIVNYDEEGNPDSVSYDRIAVALIPIIREFNNRITVLENKGA